MNARLLRRGMGWWPPFLGAGILYMPNPRPA